MRASSLYRSELWRAGIIAARALPLWLLESVAQGLALAYWAKQAARRQIVIDNLLPVVGNDRAAARPLARRLFRQFGLKLADLWRYEAGCKFNEPIVATGEWDRFEQALSRKKGLLLLTPHIGNWELGAPFLRKKGVDLLVITQAEPQESLTELRKSSRSRWGINTLVIGENPFAFVEVIRRLEGGAAVALLMDRPPLASATSVILFGKPFSASIAAAELARASGCALLQACLPRVGRTYRIEMLPELPYERTMLGNRAARGVFTQELMTQFEPLIQRYSDQWFHFVPLWQT